MAMTASLIHMFFNILSICHCRTAFKIRVRRIFGREGRERALYSAVSLHIICFVLTGIF
jgi:hypothetical protein